MEDKFTKILKELRGIKPDADYTRRSRSLILSYRRELEPESRRFPSFLGFLRDFQSMRLTLASEITGILIIIALVGFFYVNQSSNEKLVVQADELNSSIQLRLNEIKYLLQSQTTSTAAKNNLSESLRKAATDLKSAADNLKDNKMADSLEKIKSVEKAFLEIEASLKQGGDAANSVK